MGIFPVLNNETRFAKLAVPTNWFANVRLLGETDAVEACRRMERVLPCGKKGLPVNISVLPLPIRLATAMLLGPLSVGRLLAAWNVPSPLPSKIETVLLPKL